VRFGLVTNGRVSIMGQGQALVAFMGISSLKKKPKKKKYIEVEWANSEAIFVFKFWVNPKL
jgi:hypothetical protein